MNQSHVIIRNRAALASDSGWIHIVPKGELPNAEAKIVQVLDEPALDSILANITAAKNRLGDKWPGIYAGREHFIYDDTQDSAALGWFKDFEKRADGIWAKDDGLTPAGKTAVMNREYKYTSFVADRSDLKKVEGNKYRVMAIETVGFTNQANGKELLTPIVNRNNSAGAGASAASNQQQNNERTKTMKSIAQKLGLAAEASEDAILAEVTKLQNRVTELTPLAEENTKLKNRVAKADEAAVSALLASHNVKDEKVLNRLKPVITAIDTHEERVAALNDLGFKVENKPAAAAPGTRVLNRQPAAVTTTATAETPADDKELAQKIMNRTVELQGKGMKFEPAWTQARREIIAGK